MIEITSETMDRVERLLADVPKGAEKVYSRAINRGLSKIKTESRKQVRTIYSVNNKALNSATKTTVGKASTGNPAGFISFSGVKIPLYKFSVTPKKPGTGKQVRASLKRGGSGTLFEDAFIAEMRNGHTGVFERTGRKRFPVEEKMGLSAAQMIGNADIMDKLEKDVQELINERALHEMNAILNGYGGSK